MGGKQLGFGDYEQTTARKRTKRERFLAQMEAVVPWKSLIDLIEPQYPKAGSKGGRPAYPLETMLRIHLLQQWYSLSDPAMEDALMEVPTMRRSAGTDITQERRKIAATTVVPQLYPKKKGAPFGAPLGLLPD
jgi:IS5 family transposase